MAWTEMLLEDWELSGWWRNSWRSEAPGSNGAASRPLTGPIQAQVPGAVQADLLHAGLIRDWNLGLASQEAEWVEHRDWMFRTRFATPQDPGRTILFFAGLDHWGEIYLNDRRIGTFHGMFRPLEIDVTDDLVPGGDNALVVVFAAPPEVDGQIGWSSQVKEIKSRFNYQWDWCPRIVPVGFWDTVSVRTFGASRLTAVQSQADWDEETHQGRLQVHLEVFGQGMVAVRLFDSSAKEVYATKRLVGPEGNAQVNATLTVQPWTVAELGTPICYRLKVDLLDEDGVISDVHRRRIGFRTIRWQQNPGASVGALAYTVTVNGTPLFLKGVNWVPPSPLYGTVSRDTYRLWLERFRRMHVNLVRVWGGAIIEKEAFYDLCDELGILIWQEFLQSSSGIDNAPSNDPLVIADLTEVSAIAVRARRHHPSLAAWCGGNELMDDQWIPITTNHPMIHALQSMVAKEDGDRPFFPSSPSGPAFSADTDRRHQGRHHDVHGPWEFLGESDHYGYFNQDDALLRTEVGTAGASRSSLLRRMADGHRLWPPAKTEAIWRHHGAWWVPWDLLTRWFGPWDPHQDDLDHFIVLSRFLQAESIRYMVEATCRRAPQASGVVIWMGNEPYANFSNTSLVEYDGVPKPAYSVARRAFSPAHASLAYEKLAYQIGERFVATLVTQRSAPFPEVPAHPTVTLYTVTGKVLAHSAETFLGAPARLDWTVSEVPESLFLARIEPEGTTYVFAVHPTLGAPLAPLRYLPAATLKTTCHPQSERRYEVSISNPGPVAAIAVEIVSDQGWWDIWPNGVTLLPGEESRAVVENLGGDPALRLQLEGLNVRGQAFESAT